MKITAAQGARLGGAQLQSAMVERASRLIAHPHHRRRYITNRGSESCVAPCEGPAWTVVDLGGAGVGGG